MQFSGCITISFVNLQVAELEEQCAALSADLRRAGQHHEEALAQLTKQHSAKVWLTSSTLRSNASACKPHCWRSGVCCLWTADSKSFFR